MSIGSFKNYFFPNIISRIGVLFIPKKKKRKRRMRKGENEGERWKDSFSVYLFIPQMAAISRAGLIEASSLELHVALPYG